MTVQNQNVKNVYRGNGSATVFPFTFAINKEHPEYIHVYITNDGDKAVETNDFTCDMDAKTITYPKTTSSAAKLSSTQRLTTYRLLPYTQELNLVNQGPFFAEDVETELDDLEMQIQQMSENLARCFQIGVEAVDFDMTMELEPDKVICVNSAGNGFEAREALMEVNGVWNGEGRRIVSVADPISAQDVLTRHYYDKGIDNMLHIAGIVTDSGELQHIVNQFNTIDTNTQKAVNAANTATAKEASATVSATSAANSANAADATATALTNFLETKETVTAPVVDPTLIIGNAAADAKVTGSLIASYKKQNSYVAGSLYLNPNDWENGNITISTSGWTYSASPLRTRTKQGVTYNLKFGDKICMTDWTGKRMYIGWNNGSEYKVASWQTSDYTVTEDGQYVFLLSTSPEVAQTNVYNLLSSFYIISGKSLAKDTETAKLLSQCPVTEVVPESTDVIDGYCVYGNSGVVDVSTNYVCTNFIAIPKPYMGSKLVTYCTLLSNIGLAFYDKDKKFISGCSGTVNPTLEGTSKKLLPIPNGAEYVRSTLKKTAYSSPSDFTMSYVSASWFSENNTVHLTENDLQLGTIDSDGKIVLSNSARGYTHFFLLNQGDKITTSSIRFSIYEYDKKTMTLLTSTSGTWVNSYTVQNDCYARLLYLSNDFATCIADTVFNTKGRVLTKLPVVDIAKDVATLYNGEPQKPGIIHGGIRATGNYSYISAAHRGYNMAAPENTLPAFKMAREKGFEWVETDIQFTSDGVPVLLHDWTVDRTSNGTGKITDMTYAEAEALDFGSWKSPYFAGTKILKLDDFLRFCRNVGLNAVLEFKPNVPYTTAQLRTIFDLVKKYHMADNVLWIPTGYITETLTEFPKAKVCLGVNSAITQPSVDQAVALQTEHNIVYILTPCTQNDDASIAIAEASNVPVIYWNVQNETHITSASPYVSGFITDGVFPNDVLYQVGMNM